MIGILPLIIKKTRPIYNRAGQKCGNNGPGGAGNLPRGFAAGEMEPVGSKRRGFAVGDPARRSRDGDGKRAVRGGEAMAAKRTNRTGSFRAAKRRARFCAANPKGGADDRPARFRAAKWSRTATSAGVLPLGPRRAPGQRGRPQPSSASSPFSLSSPSSSSMGCHACPNFTSLKSAVSPVICLRRRSSSLSMPRCFAIHASERPSS